MNLWGDHFEIHKLTQKAAHVGYVQLGFAAAMSIAVDYVLANARQ